MVKHESRLLLPFIITAIMMTNATAMSTEEIAKKKPHIILIVADDLGWNDVSWNNPYVYSPYMNDLAVRGVILNQSYVQPTCTPTRTALMTGRYPFTIGLQQGVIGPLEPMGVPIRSKMLPQFLRNVGYSTHAIGKWHLGFCSWHYTPLRRGFDTFYGFYTGASDYYSHKRSALRKGKRTEYLDLRNDTKVDYGKGGVYSTYIFASAAEEIIRSRKPEDPMFMYLAFQSVHSPLQVPLQYKTLYSHINKYERRVYLGMVTAMDEAIGRVVKALKDTGHYENSVIIFTTDNGGSVKKGGSNWPLRGGKGSLWEGGTRGPAFIHSPLLPNPGTVNEYLHHATDWFSTIISIAGAETPPKVDGTNQWDVLAGISSIPQREAIVHNMDDSKKYKAGLRMNNYKLLVGGMARKAWVSTPEAEDAPNRRNPRKTKQKFKQMLKRIAQSSVVPLHKKKQVAKLTLPESTHGTQEVLNSESSTDTHEEATPQSHRNVQYIFWNKLREDPSLQIENRVINILGGYFKDRTKIRLYNLEDDPEERNNLSAVETNRTLSMLSYLAEELMRYKEPLIRKDNTRGHPMHWHDVWTPGWCTAQW